VAFATETLRLKTTVAAEALEAKTLAAATAFAKAAVAAAATNTALVASAITVAQAQATYVMATGAEPEIIETTPSLGPRTPERVIYTDARKRVCAMT